MMAYTHTAVGIGLGSVLALELAPALGFSFLQTAALALSCVAGSYLPDIDHPHSTIGRRMRPLSDLVSAIFGHRGITHSLLAVLAFGALIAWSLTHFGASAYIGAPLVIGLSAGYLSHLAGDYLTPSGIPLFWPKKERYRSPIVIFTGGGGEAILCAAIYAATSLYVAQRLGWLA